MIRNKGTLAPTLSVLIGKLIFSVPIPVKINKKAGQLPLSKLNFSSNCHMLRRPTSLFVCLLVSSLHSPLLPPAPPPAGSVASSCALRLQQARPRKPTSSSPPPPPSPTPSSPPPLSPPPPYIHSCSSHDRKSSSSAFSTPGLVSITICICVSVRLYL